MSNIKPLAGLHTPAEHFDDRTALHLVQAFHQESDLTALLKLMLGQLQTLAGAHGLRLTLPAEYGIADLSMGNTTRHNIEYNLNTDKTRLGTMTLYFPVRRNEHEIQTCEDLLALAFTALRNATALHVARQRDTGQRGAAPTTDEARSDALILIALDGYAHLREHDGEEWAHVIMSSVHNQIHDGLRNADGVYQISDEFIAVLLPNTSLEQAQEVASKIRILVASLHLRNDDVDHQLTVCMGVSDALLANTAEEVMSNARIALTQAQADGTNQIRCYDEALVAELGVR